MKRELTPNEILFHFDLDGGEYELELKDIPQINSAYKKIKRAISIDKDNFNVYLVDSFSKYRLNELIKYVKDIYKDRRSPKDICYVTFEDYRRPEPIFLNNGNGNKLKEAVEEIKNKYFDIVIEFYNSSSDNEKDRIIDEVSTKRSAYITELIDMAKVQGFDLKATSGGFAFIPLKSEGEAITEKEYDDLSEENKESIVGKVSFLKKKAETILDKIKDIEVVSIKKLKDLYKEYLSNNMEEEKEDLLLDFITDDNAYDYLEKIFALIEKDLVNCYTISLEEDHAEINKVLNNYEIRVLVDNSNNKYPRVIYEEDPTIDNLFGNIEYENHNGSYTTDLSLITPGSLLLANEGCIIIRMSQLIMNNYSYIGLKKTLLTRKVNIDSYRNYLELLSISSIKPKSIPVDLKVILIGDYESYDILYNADEDFKGLFPIRCEFLDYINNDKVSRKIVKNLITERFKKFSIDKISDEAIKEIVRYFCRKAESREKIRLNVDEIDKLILQVIEETKEKSKNEINREDIINVVYEEEIVVNELVDMYKKDKILVSVDGSKVGSINGLAVIDSGYHRFGKPIKLNCIASRGSGKIIDIQCESNLSGNIHEKSVNILSGILNNIIEPYKKLPVDFFISFEQIYGIVDGDSASVAEMICILSAFSKVAIKQNIAVTGSLNLFGEVQPIGGVVDKIEGYYNICRAIDKEKEIGVLIPTRNIDELIFKPDIEEAISKGNLRIYVMNDINDAMDVLMESGSESVLDSVNKELEKYK